MSDKLLEVKNLSVEYDTEISTVYAVNGLDLDLNYTWILVFISMK